MFEKLTWSSVLPLVGNVATVVIAVLAVITLVFTIRSSDREKVRFAADDIRRQLLTLSHQVETVDTMLKDSMFISMTSLGRNIGEELTKRIQQPEYAASTESYVEFLSKKENQQIKLTVVGEAWEQNNAVRRLLSGFDSLSFASHQLVGSYFLYGKLASAYVPHKHGVSPGELIRILDDMVKLEGNDRGIGATELPDILGEVAGAMIGKELQFRKAMRRFFVSSVQCVVGLSDERVNDLARVRLSSTDTYSGDARQLAELIGKASTDSENRACSTMLESVSELESIAATP